MQVKMLADEERIDYSAAKVGWNVSLGVFLNFVYHFHNRDHHRRYLI